MIILIHVHKNYTVNCEFYYFSSLTNLCALDYFLFTYFLFDREREIIKQLYMFGQILLYFTAWYIFSWYRNIIFSVKMLYFYREILVRVRLFFEWENEKLKWKCKKWLSTYLIVNKRVFSFILLYFTLCCQLTKHQLKLLPKLLTPNHTNQRIHHMIPIL